MAKYLRKECGDLNGVVEDDDDDNANSKDVEIVQIGTSEALTMLDRLEKIRVLNKKQSYINDYFILE